MAYFEAKPSSDLVVAGFAKVMDQPMFLMDARKGELTTLPISLSADDPISFATTLDDEYAYARAALAEVQGPGFAQAWVDRVAAQGWRARFTDPKSAALLDEGAPGLVGRRAWARPR